MCWQKGGIFGASHVSPWQSSSAASAAAAAPTRFAAHPPSSQAASAVLDFGFGAPKTNATSIFVPETAAHGNAAGCKPAMFSVAVGGSEGVQAASAVPDFGFGMPRVQAAPAVDAEAAQVKRRPTTAAFLFVRDV